MTNSNDQAANLADIYCESAIEDVSPAEEVEPSDTIFVTLLKPNLEQAEFFEKNGFCDIIVTECKFIPKEGRGKPTGIAESVIPHDKVMPTQYIVRLPAEILSGFYRLYLRIEMRPSSGESMFISAATDGFPIHIMQHQRSDQTIKVNVVAPKSFTDKEFKTGKARFTLTGQNLHFIEKITVINGPNRNMQFIITSAQDQTLSCKVMSARDIEAGQNFKLSYVYSENGSQKTNTIQNAIIEVESEHKLDPTVDLQCISVFPEYPIVGTEVDVETTGLSHQVVDYYKFSFEQGNFNLKTLTANLSATDSAANLVDVRSSIKFDPIEDQLTNIRFTLPEDMSPGKYRLNLTVLIHCGTWQMGQLIKFRSSPMKVKSPDSGGPEGKVIKIMSIYPKSILAKDVKGSFVPGNPGVLQEIRFLLKGENLDQIKSLALANGLSAKFAYLRQAPDQLLFQITRVQADRLGEAGAFYVKYKNRQGETFAAPTTRVQILF